MQKIVYIKTFGCQMNERDSEIIAQTLAPYGYVEGASAADADLIILNTCSIRAKAEQKVMSLLGYLRKEKEARPELKICVAGCVAQQEGKKIINRMPHVDLVIGTQEIYNIGELLEASDVKIATNLVDEYKIPRFIPDEERLVSSPSLVYKKFVTIMQGCNNFCTYCVVPHTRGREVSRKFSDILEEAQVLVHAGIKEITLLGQNVNSYGRANSVTNDNSGYDFSDLVCEVSKIEGLKRLRFTTSNPKDLTDKLMRCFRDIPIVCPQFHLPVQAGSNSVLKRMNRKYTIEKYLELVLALKTYCPDIALTTDVIVGFPGETDEDFENTMDLLETVRFHGSYSFKYSDRPGTASINLDGKVEEVVKSERLARFQKRQDEICLQHNENFVGSEVEVMVEGFDGESLKTRAETNHLVHIKTTVEIPVGKIVTARVIRAGQHSLTGELI